MNSWLPGSSSPSLDMPSDSESNTEETLVATDIYLENVIENITVVEEILPVAKGEISSTIDNIQVTNLTYENSITIKNQEVARNSSNQRKVTSNNDECSELTNLVDKNNNLKYGSINFGNLCPNCQLLKNANTQKVDATFMNKDIFVKILLAIMFFVTILNFILYKKLINLEKVANILHGELDKNMRLN